MKKKRLWVVVADGANARILKDVTAAGHGEELVLQAQQARLGEIVSDRAGRSFASVGSRRSAIELHSDPVRDGERAFAGEIAKRLREHAMAGDFDALAIVAAPRTLGDLREAIPVRIRRTITHELVKNYTNLQGKKLWETVRDELDLPV
jgi:protein required for attachment to host cells